MASRTGGDNATAVGTDASAAGNAVAFGMQAYANGVSASAFGKGSNASGGGSLALGSLAEATSFLSVAVGSGARAGSGGFTSTALGALSNATALQSVALGTSAVADRDYTVSIGNGTMRRQLVNLAAGTEDTDAVNLSQLYPLASALGGGADFNGAFFTPPTYVIQSNNYNNAGSAFNAVNNALTDINQRIVNAGGIQGERGASAYEVAVQNGFAGSEGDWLSSLQGSDGATGPAGPEGPAGPGLGVLNSVRYDDDSHAQLTLTVRADRVSNVADAVEAGDAVNLGQMQAGDAATLIWRRTMPMRAMPTRLKRPTATRTTPPPRH